MRVKRGLTWAETWRRLNMGRKLTQNTNFQPFQSSFNLRIDVSPSKVCSNCLGFHLEHALYQWKKNSQMGFSHGLQKLWSVSRRDNERHRQCLCVCVLCSRLFSPNFKSSRRSLSLSSSQVLSLWGAGQSQVSNLCMFTFDNCVLMIFTEHLGDVCHIWYFPDSNTWKKYHIWQNRPGVLVNQWVKQQWTAGLLLSWLYIQQMLHAHAHSMCTATQ